MILSGFLRRNAFLLAVEFERECKNQKVGKRFRGSADKRGTEGGLHENDLHATRTIWALPKRHRRSQGTTQGTTRTTANLIQGRPLHTAGDYTETEWGARQDEGESQRAMA